jgi:hypothetical protein
MFPVRCEHHLLYIKKVNITRRQAWRGINVFPVRYERNRHIKSKVISVTGPGDP